MAKLAIINDLHLGARTDSKVFLRHQEKFFSEIFFPTLKEYNIDTVLCLGDIFDRRKFINFFSLKRSKEFLFDPLRDNNITMHTILGNHDTTFTNTNEVNSVALLLKEYSNIYLYEDEPTELKFDNTRFLMAPWFTKENIANSMKIIKNSTADVLCGHLDLKGFEMMRGVLSDHGMDHAEFNHFEAVYSGHYHHPSHYGNVKYLGAQYEMNWSDYGVKKGFYLIDTETRDLTFIENPNKIYHKIEYDDLDLTIDEIASLDTSMLRDCFIKVMVRNRTNPYLYDMFLTRLNESGAADVKTIEDLVNLDGITVDDMMEEAKDTKDILHTYIDNVETKLDKIKIKKVIDELYLEAMNI